MFINQAAEEGSSLWLHGARVVQPHRVVEDAGVLVEGGRIRGVFERSRSEQPHTARAAAARDMSGLTLLPGFIDLHIHGAVGVDLMEATVEDLRRVALFLASRGVTSWLPTLVPAPAEDYQRAVSTVETLIAEERERPPAASAIGLHYEGPFVNGAQCGALRPQYFRDFSERAHLESLPVIGREGAARMITVAPEIRGGLELVRELAAGGWVVSIGHTRAGVETLDGALAAGARHMTHFMNAMSPLHHREPGPVGWGLIRDEVTCDVIADGVHLDPLMLKLLLRCKTPERLALISDAVAPTGLGDGEYRVWGETITVRAGRTSNERGSIAGSVITMADAVRLMLRAGASLTEVALMSASNPARLLGLERDYGSLEEGKRADLLALDDDGSVRLTLVGGRVAFDNTPARP